MIDFLRDIGPVGQAFVATVGTYLLTAIGTLPVLFFRTAPRRLMDAMMGFAAVPGGTETTRSGAVDVATLGFITGFVVMMALDNAPG